MSQRRMAEAARVVIEGDRTAVREARRGDARALVLDRRAEIVPDRRRQPVESARVEARRDDRAAGRVDPSAQPSRVG